MWFEELLLLPLPVPLAVKPPTTETLVAGLTGVPLFESCSNSNRVSLITRSLNSCVSLIWMVLSALLEELASEVRLLPPPGFVLVPVSYE